MDINQTIKNRSANRSLIITKTNIPVLRAGIGNLFFPGVIFFVIMGNEFVKDFNIFFIGWAIIILIVSILTFNYLSTASKIIFHPEKITIVKTFNSIDIRTKDIVNAKVLNYRSNSFIRLKFRVKGKPFNVISNFVVMKKTSFGDFEKTAHLIKEILKEYNVALV